MKTLSIVMIAAAASLYLSACNTISGFGKDIQKGGEAIERTAE
ncbi:entericidin A/B family lipoprotein [Nitrosomonas aestuarii]|nr:entericidin A/B family lipoprotein [Nitrosomonas aestuarii]PTN12665.1 putative small secreted protein [Nitrosomonas aestuarii]